MGAVHARPDALGWIARQTDLEQRVQNEGRLYGLDSTFCLNRALEQTVRLAARTVSARTGRLSDMQRPRPGLTGGLGQVFVGHGAR